MTLNLLELADAELVRKKLSRPKMANWPTDSSTELTDLLGQKSVIGKCMRYLWYKWRGIGESNPAGAKAQRIFAMGNSIEASEIEIHKKIGIWFDNNIKFFDKDLNLSGEIDEIVYADPAERGKEDPALVIVEFKSTHGYFTEKQIFGDRRKRGSPKADHVMQIALYLYCNKNIPYGKIIYIFRDKALRKEFDVRLKYDKETKRHQILVDGRRTIGVDEPFLPETITMDIEDILERFAKIKDVVEKDKPPEREFSLQYSKDELKFLYEKGRLSKAHKRVFEGGGLPRKGDWRCVAKGTKVLTSNSWKNIEDVEPGEMVMTTDGFKAVINKKFSGIKSNMVKVSPYLLDDYYATNDHEILLGSSDNHYFYKSKMLSNTKFTKISDIDMDEINYVIAPINRKINNGNLSDDELLVLGNFITEGNYHKQDNMGHIYKVGFTYNINEKENAIKVGEACLKLGATSYKTKEVIDTRYGRENHYLILRVYGVNLVRFLKKHISGHYSYNKTFKPHILEISPDQQMKLLYIMNKQDGCVLYVRTSKLMDYSTTSKGLALQVQQMFLRNNKIAAIVRQRKVSGRKVFGGKYEQRESYHVRHFPEATFNYGFIVDDLLFARLRAITPVDEEMETMDLTIEGNPEFLTQGGIVHNCGYCSFKDICWETCFDAEPKEDPEEIYD